MSPDSEEIQHESVDREKPLRLRSGFEPAHLSLVLSRRLMRNLCAVVRVSVRAMGDGRHDRSVRSPVAAQLVGDFRHAPAAGPWASSCSAALARPVAACATIAGRFVSVARARAAAHRRAVSGHCRPRPRAGAGGPCPLTRCRVVRGGGVMRCAGRRGRPCGAADGLAPPAPAAPDRRPAGLRRRAVPARE